MKHLLPGIKIMLESVRRTLTLSDEERLKGAADLHAMATRALQGTLTEYEQALLETAIAARRMQAL